MALECEDCREYNNKETSEDVELRTNPQHEVWEDLRGTDAFEEDEPPEKLWLCGDCVHQRFMDT